MKDSQLFLLLASWNLAIIIPVHSEIYDRQFPEYFIFGSATSSYQIEGAWNIDGKGQNIWDNLTHARPDRIVDGSSGDIACDSYHRYKEDVQLLVNAGVDFYRFSISWARIMPDGVSTQLNERGLEYYDNLIDELLRYNIEPVITMFHWDLPQALQDLGGFLNSDIVHYFEEYADVLFERYGQRVRTWITFNEPYQICNEGYGSGLLAPFIQSVGVGNYLCSHHLLIANALMYSLYERKYRRPDGMVGISLSGAYSWPKDRHNAADVAAAERAMQFYIGNYLHPLLSADGGYPPVMIEYVARHSDSRLPIMSNVLRDFVKGKTDFVGLNYYTSTLVASASNDEVEPSLNSEAAIETSVDPSWPRAKSEWLYSVPRGLYNLLNWIRFGYGNPVVIITENGWSDDGQLNDTGRIEYYREHLEATLDAIDDGCNVIGHTSWSLMDNFEWTSGYTARFGIHHVDFTVPQRTRRPKASVKFLRDIYTSRTIPN